MRLMKLCYFLSSFFVAAILMSSCKDNPTTNENFTVTLTVANLKPLTSAEGHYELWISFPEETRALHKPGHGDQAYVSFGKFNVNANNQLVDLSGNAKSSFTPGANAQVDINLAVDALITVELSGDNNDEPGSRMLGGLFFGTDRQATAILKPDGEDVFDFDYTRSSGSYILMTPSTADTSDANHGIWWMTANNTAGLSNLPTLTDTSGWRYEGWVIDQSGGQPVFYSTGKFLNAAGPDADGPGATAGGSSGFAFPGQDFIQAANGVPLLPGLDNGNFAARITLEPAPDNSTQPFQLVILNDDKIETAGGVMANRVATNYPTATIMISR